MVCERAVRRACNARVRIELTRSAGVQGVAPNHFGADCRTYRAPSSGVTQQGYSDLGDVASFAPPLGH
jgi:hypothetical protein